MDTPKLQRFLNTLTRNGFLSRPLPRETIRALREGHRDQGAHVVPTSASSPVAGGDLAFDQTEVTS